MSESARPPRNFWVRLLTALVFVPLVMAVLVAGGGWFTLGAMLIGGLVGLELAYMAGPQRLNRWHSLAAIGTALLVPILAYIAPLPIVVPVIAALLVAIAFGWLALPDHTLRRPTPLLRQVIVIGWAALLAGVAVALRDHPYGLALWFLVITSTWSMDTLSYAGGRAYGRRPLAPRISPKKTIEGALTGIVGAWVLNGAMLAYFGGFVPPLLLIAAGAPFAALLGDLTASRIKRAYGAKDSSVPHINIVPGHGGMLDRVDGLLLAAAFAYCVVYAGGVL